ncbi:hypothetical protein RSK20926_02429 [Roseobacter sp. SK209-2-6]|uniref:hypothetical protein n=1 Tax=Roseobacter sp. SK209-2-6 TaxID=388739 RepID=UPI0000F3EB5C|nr:hypothetical protein [Roseobacter sp. SK209-2-6]EBA16624.1 hypothetical protein RSK20926_02429 [Roseobacter sp. SK209-2-6]
MPHIRTVARLLILPMGIFVIYYFYKGMEWQLNIAFLEPERWMKSRYVSPEAVVETSTRIFYFVMWQVPLYCGLTAYAFAVICLIRLARGYLFDQGIARCCMMIGTFTAVSSGSNLIAAAFSPMILSWHNPEGPAPLRFWYSSTHFSLVFYGFAFLMMGWILQEAIRVDKENREFV